MSIYGIGAAGSPAAGYCGAKQTQKRVEDTGFSKQISDMRLLNQRKAVSYYQYSMQTYWDFMCKK